LVSGPFVFAMKKRCNSKSIFNRCIGVHGHDDWHFCYDEFGWLHRWPGRKEKSEIAHRIIPPTDDEYIHPADAVGMSYINAG